MTPQTAGRGPKIPYSGEAATALERGRHGIFSSGADFRPDRSGYGSLLCCFLIEQPPQVTRHLHAHVIHFYFLKHPNIKSEGWLTYTTSGAFGVQGTMNKGFRKTK